MAGELKRGGIIFLKLDGGIQQAKGEFTYNLGRPKRDAIVGSDGIHGYVEVPQVPFVEGEITDHPDLDLNEYTTRENMTLTLELANGKVIVMRNAWYAGEGTGNTAEGNIGVRFEAISGEEIR